MGSILRIAKYDLNEAPKSISETYLVDFDQIETYNPLQMGRNIFKVHCSILPFLSVSIP